MGYMATTACLNQTGEVPQYLVKSLEEAAQRVRLAIAIDPVTKELYGYASPALNEKATMRRVALFVHGSGSVELKTSEKDLVLPIIRARFDERFQ